MIPDDLPVTITLPEFIGRMKDMQETGGGGSMMFGEMPMSLSVTVNANHSMTKKMLGAESDEEKEKWAKQAYDLAVFVLISSPV